jgi:hypothetical protein
MGWGEDKLVRAQKEIGNDRELWELLLLASPLIHSSALLPSFFSSLLPPPPLTHVPRRLLAITNDQKIVEHFLAALWWQ